MAIKARQYRVMGVPIPVVLIEVPPFILLSTPRAVVRGPENPPGVEWRVPNSRTGHRDRKRRRESATNILINGLSCTTGITYSRNKTCGKLRHTRSDNSDARGRREHAPICASDLSDSRLQKYESSKKMAGDE